MSFPLEYGLTPGHDLFGRSLWSLLPGAALTSTILASAVALTTPILATGLPLALALLSKKSQAIARWLQDLLLPIPAIAVSLSLASVTTPGYAALTAALVFGALPAQLRYLLALAQEILSQDFALQSRALGSSPFRILCTHLLPALPGWMRAQFPQLFANALIGEAVLSFIGVGAPLGDDTLGTLLLQGKEYTQEAPWILASTSLSLIALLSSIKIARGLGRRHWTRLSFFRPSSDTSAKL